jgi:hypothetical protein
MRDNTHLAIARRYANAYAAFDSAELLDVLAPDLRFRQENPGGYLEVNSAQAYVDGTKAFLDGYDTHAAITATVRLLATPSPRRAAGALVPSGQRGDGCARWLRRSDGSRRGHCRRAARRLP